MSALHRVETTPYESSVASSWTNKWIHSGLIVRPTVKDTTYNVLCPLVIYRNTKYFDYLQFVCTRMQRSIKYNDAWSIPAVDNWQNQTKEIFTTGNPHRFRISQKTMKPPHTLENAYDLLKEELLLKRKEKTSNFTETYFCCRCCFQEVLDCTFSVKFWPETGEIGS